MAQMSSRGTPLRAALDVANLLLVCHMRWNGTITFPICIGNDINNVVGQWLFGDIVSPVRTGEVLVGSPKACSSCSVDSQAPHFAQEIAAKSTLSWHSCDHIVYQTWSAQELSSVSGPPEATHTQLKASWIRVLDPPRGSGGPFCWKGTATAAVKQWEPSPNWPEGIYEQDPLIAWNTLDFHDFMEFLDLF